MGSRQESDSYNSLRESAMLAVSTACLGKAPNPDGAGREEVPEKNPEWIETDKVKKGQKGGKGCGVCEAQQQREGLER